MKVFFYGDGRVFEWSLKSARGTHNSTDNVRFPIQKNAVFALTNQNDPGVESSVFYERRAANFALQLM